VPHKAPAEVFPKTEFSTLSIDRTNALGPPVMTASPTNPGRARFVTGSIRRHILVMTGTGAVGLMAIFVGDLANLIFLGLLGDTEILAAVGYASSLLFFSVSMGIGLAIGATSVVSPAVGAGQRQEAQRLATSALALTALISAAVSIAALPFLSSILQSMGARGRTLALALDYLWVIFPSFPLLAVGMTCSAILRSVGDAQRAMYVTLGAAIVNVVLDPIFIFVLQGGMLGAAWASVFARAATTLVGLYGVSRIHGMLQWPSLGDISHDSLRILRVSVPAVLTNLATPAANAFVTAALAAHGDAAVAAWSVYGRINPVAFGPIFALTGSLGAIIGQNFGAQNFPRVRETVTEAALISVVFGLIAWAGLALSPSAIIQGFGLTGEAARLTYHFCWWLPPFFIFLGFLFVANAVFNTLGHAQYATLFNWGRATLGTLPFVAAGDYVAGAHGIFTGSVAGGVLFGLGALWVAYGLIARLESSPAASSQTKPSI
jgi:putative MATE family efflux protein